MASPFSVFRKHQKFLMMAACLLAIIAFVFLPNMGNLIRKKSAGREDLIVVKTKKFGDLRESDVSRLRQSKQKVRAVLIELGQAAQPAGSDPRAVEQTVTSLFGSAAEEDVVLDWLKVQRARELGMVVSDDTITRFLEKWTDNRVPINTIQDAFRHSPAVSDAQFYSLLRDELLAQQLVTMFVPSLEIGGQLIATPSQRWDWFNRVNRMAVIEAVPLAVADYVKNVEKPTDEVLKKFFEDNKDTIAYPASAAPGFKRPQKVAIEYFKADIDKFAATVTDADVRKQYEENKDAYDRYFRIPPTPQPAKQGAAKSAENTKTATEAKPEAKATRNVPKANTPGETPKTEQKKPATETKEGTSKQSPKAAGPKEQNRTGDSKGASSAGRTTPFMFAAMQQVEKKSADKPKSPSASEPAVKSAPAAKAEPPAKPEKPAAKEQKPASEKPAAEEKTETHGNEMPVALKTFIRRQLAFEKIEKAFTGLRKPVEKYQQDCRKYDLQKIQLEREKKKVPPPPVSPNFEKLAAENGMSTGRTKLLPVWEMQKPEVGASLIGGQLPVWAYIYQAPKFRCEESIDGHAAYLFWKSDDVKEDVPTFDDKGVYEEVLHSWKMIQARSIAKKAAKSLADESNKAGKSLKQAFRNHLDLRVVLPPKFSWMTISNVAPTFAATPPGAAQSRSGRGYGRRRLHGSRFPAGTRPGGCGLQCPGNRRVRRPPERVHSFVRGAMEAIPGRQLRDVCRRRCGGAESSSPRLVR